jgi:hypothetical protein
MPNDFEVFTIGARSDALPVTLVDFEARKESNTAILNWITTSETDSDYFLIEQSNNGTAWNGIGTVKSFGTSSVRQQYGFADSAPMNGTNYYRLKMVDTDGTYAFSSIKSLHFDITSQKIIVYPNPATNSIRIQSLLIGSDQRKHISITDLNGRNYNQLLKWNGSALNIEKLTNGVYILTVPAQSGEPVQVKFVVQK